MSGPHEEHQPSQALPQWSPPGVHGAAGDLLPVTDPPQAPVWSGGPIGAQPASPWVNSPLGCPPQSPAERYLTSLRRRRTRQVAVLAGMALLLVVAGTDAVLTSIRSGHRAASAQALRSGVDRTLASATVEVLEDAQVADGTGGFNAQERLDLAHGRGEGGLSVGTGRIRTISDGHTIWYSSNAAAFTAQLPPGVSWAAGNLAKLIATGAMRPAADSLAVLYLTRGAISVHDDGPDVVNGVAARRYSFPLDLNRAYCATDPAERPAVQRAFHVQGSFTITGQAWIDRLGRAVKLLITATGTGTSTGRGLRFEVDLADFNTPVSLTPPPAGQTTPSTPALLAAAVGTGTDTDTDTGTQPPTDCP